MEKNNLKNEVTRNTFLKLKKEWKTPYNNFQIGDGAELEYFAHKLGKTTQQLIADFIAGSLDNWFEII